MTTQEIIQAFEALLPPHKAGLTLQHNANRTFHQTVEEYVSDQCTQSGWPNAAAYDQATNTQELWELQWYPETPIGSHSLCAPTLEQLLNLTKECK